MTRDQAIDNILAIVDAAVPAPDPIAAVPSPAGSGASGTSAGSAAFQTEGPAESAPAKKCRGGKPPKEPQAPGPEDPHALDLRLAFLPRTDLGNVERFRERNRDRLIYCETLPGASRSEGGWLWWDGRRWSLAGATSKVKLYEHGCVRGIQEEAKACEREAERLSKDFPAALKLASKARKAAEKKAKGKKPELRLAAVDGVALAPLDMEGAEKKRRPPSDEKVGARLLQLWQLALALRKWGRASEANSKMVPIARHAAAYLGIEQTDLDADLFAFNVRNGTFIFRREWDEAKDPRLKGHAAWRARGDYIKFKPHDPADKITRLAPVDYDPDAGCPQFQRFLGEVQPEEAMRAFLQCWKGYQLTGDTGEARVAIFKGSGRNGKGVFETATNYALGDYAGATPIETFTVEARSRSAGQATPELAKLPGVRALRSSEPKKGAQLDEALIKLVTGGDPIDARHLNRPFFTFLPHFKLTIQTNPNLVIKDTSEGMWARVTKVPWDVFIPEERRDAKLADRLQAEASGILNWMLDGLSVWMEQGLKLPETVKAATAEYRHDSDQLGRFLDENTERDPPGIAKPSRARASAVLELHNAWARSGGGSEWRVKGMHDALLDRGFKQIQSNGMWWLGFKLTRSVNDYVDHEGKPLAGQARPEPATVGEDDEF